MCEHCKHLSWQEYLEDTIEKYKEQYFEILEAAEKEIKRVEKDEYDNEEIKGRISWYFDVVTFGHGLFHAKFLVKHFEQENIYKVENSKYLLELIERAKDAHKKSTDELDKLAEAISKAEQKVLN
jgi:hypothetical protein